MISYSELAKVCKTSPRAIGRILNKNRDPDEYPCYKVIRKNGEIGGYKWGLKEKIKRLKKDGIKIKNGKVPESYFWKFK